MMKMTIVTDTHGKLVGVVTGHTLGSKDGKVQTKLSFGPGHKLHKVEVDDDIAHIADPDLFHQSMVKHVPKS